MCFQDFNFCSLLVVCLFAFCFVFSSKRRYLGISMPMFSLRSVADESKPRTIPGSALQTKLNPGIVRGLVSSATQTY